MSSSIISRFSSSSCPLQHLYNRVLSDCSSSWSQRERGQQQPWELPRAFRTEKHRQRLDPQEHGQVEVYRSQDSERINSASSATDAENDNRQDSKSSIL